MVAPRGALFDPLLEQCNLLRRDRLMQPRRRHHFVGVGAFDPPDDRAGFRLARHDGDGTFVIALGRRLQVEPQPGFARFVVGPMTGETVFRQERSNVATKRNLVGTRYSDRRRLSDNEGNEKRRDRERMLHGGRLRQGVCEQTRIIASRHRSGIHSSAAKHAATLAPCDGVVRRITRGPWRAG